MGYVGLANYREFSEEVSDPHDAVHHIRYGWNGEGVCLDVRYITDEMLEIIQALEDYMLISDDRHSEIKCEAWDEAWESSYRSDFRKGIEKLLDSYAPEDTDAYWAEEVLDSVADLDSKLDSLFNACREQANVYPTFEDTSCAPYIDMDAVLSAVDTGDLRDLTGLPLLPPDQEWRRDPYPWLGSSPAPLVPSLPLA
jgi:hypothetical protein